MMRKEWNKKWKDLFHDREKLRRILGEFIYALQHHEFDRVEKIAEQLGIMTPNRQKKIAEITMLLVSEQVFLEKQFQELCIELKRIEKLADEEQGIEFNKIVEKFEALLKQAYETEKDRAAKEKVLQLAHDHLVQAIQKFDQEIKERKEKIERLEFRYKELNVLVETYTKELISTMHHVADDILAGKLIPSDIPVDIKEFHPKYLIIVDRFEKNIILLDSAKEEFAKAIIASPKEGEIITCEKAIIAADIFYEKIAPVAVKLTSAKAGRDAVGQEIIGEKYGLKKAIAKRDACELLKSKLEAGQINDLDLTESEISRILAQVEHAQAILPIPDEKKVEAKYSAKYFREEREDKNLMREAALAYIVPAFENTVF
jgi:hypothetical protein